MSLKCWDGQYCRDALQRITIQCDRVAEDYNTVWSSAEVLLVRRRKRVWFVTRLQSWRVNPKYLLTVTRIKTQSFVYIHVHIHLHIYICIYTYKYAYTYIHIHTHTHMYIHIHVYMPTYLYVHTCIFVYIYTYIHTYLWYWSNLHLLEIGCLGKRAIHWSIRPQSRQ